MCEESSALPINRRVNAVAGTTYVLRDIGDAPGRPGRTKRVAALVIPGTQIKGDGLPACVACVSARTLVRIKVSFALHKSHGLPRYVDAVLLPSQGKGTEIAFAYGARMDLVEMLDKDVQITVIRELAIGENLTDVCDTLAQAA